MAEQQASAQGSQKLMNDLNDRFRDAVEKTRTRADTTMKALLGLGTTALTALGISKFADVFPLPPGGRAWFAIVVLLASFIGMALVVVFFTLRLSRLSDPLVMASDPELITDLRNDDQPTLTAVLTTLGRWFRYPVPAPAPYSTERELVDSLYTQAADANQVQSLAAYEARADRLERIADRLSDDDEAQQIRDQAALIRSTVIMTLGRAALAIMRHRTSTALRRGWAPVLYVAFLAAVIGFGLSADYLDSARAGEVKVATDCAAAQKGGAVSTPEICKPYVSATTSTAVLDPEAEVDTGRDQVSAALTRCRAAARKAGKSADVCAPLQRALTESLRR